MRIADAREGQVLYLLSREKCKFVKMKDRYHAIVKKRGKLYEVKVTELCYTKFY